MHGPTRRLIKQLGETYTVRNADGNTSGRSTPSYEDDGSVTAVIERRSAPEVHIDSDGSEVRTDTELRVVGDATIREAGDVDGYPSQLVHPDGYTYEVKAVYPEDSGVTVLSVERT
jgi:hypothetical protein